MSDSFSLSETLPPELYLAIISHIPTHEVKQSVLAFSRALARSPVPTYPLFENVRLRYPQRVLQFYQRLRKVPQDANYVRSFSLETWAVDADIVVNLLSLLSHLAELRLFIGPNFAPEHLEEIFERSRPGLGLVSLRFRPYVQKAAYYQFLKGAYFDSTLLALSRWPPESLPALSIVQDPLDPSIAPTKFAQPLVFFRLDPLSTLAQSPLLEDLTQFRLRVPSRQVARYLYTTSHSLPSVKLLDLSTCNVTDSDVEGLLGRFVHLEALILDKCPIISQRTDIHVDEAQALNQWAILAKTMALAGVKFARERERKLKTWLEAYHARATTNREPPAEEPRQQDRRPRRGRRGLATATISLRASPPRETMELPNLDVKSSKRIPPPSKRVRIMPLVPALRSLAATPPHNIGPDKHAAIRAEFERGWAEGIAQISAIRGRLQTSWRNGVKIVTFGEDEDDSYGDRDHDTDVGLSGLIDVEDDKAFALEIFQDGQSQSVIGRCPTLCLIGPGTTDGHADGCGHRFGWDIWKDDL
ncbi:hypothetical protein CERSUDRAFT_120779 [Gelatoporia subvermispora B]|uniref:F-box domain-containing protein n=1 Tax=Ceriporiopsis subvermispora (strain B) TaxID=914234 RepID=M2PY93_CERS8|nr:hypothetical protein CERSUDRAFT_120779 [Gelatoporia subvermispora B]